ncbi:neutrophilic granule protein (predicted) [Rattus norvegicus]|uniref:Neutrophilic granule protein (Predicted) n=2 Tax=Rattus norvegicus TaxID=10116 RepID=A6I3E3_RAT|nr:neutrophilic granule protein precursor [Rattus norvegicus]EDL77084.1 neutrophilic granule protein (predicted) [Rattus norvegicus]|eukprot:NP_001100332.1 neutrophilic granule protein precursor [Rattus norvegicus]
MARLWKTFMLVVALAVVACEAHRRLRYEDIVNRAIEAYNRGQRGRPLFRLLSATPPPGQNPTSNVPLEFRIKETVCISTTERRLENCDFREGGEERNCTGEFSRRQWSTSLTLTCDRDCRREVSQVATFSDNKSDDSEKDKLEGLPPHAKNIYENAKYDIISNILHNF